MTPEPLILLTSQSKVDMYLAGIDSSGKLEYIAIVVCKMDKLTETFKALDITEGFHMRKEGSGEKRRVAKSLVRYVNERSYLRAICIRANIIRLAEDYSHEYRTPRKRALIQVEKFCQKELLKTLKKTNVDEIHYDNELSPLVKDFQGNKKLKGPAVTLADILAWINLKGSDLNIDEPQAITFIDLEKMARERLRI